MNEQTKQNIGYKDILYQKEYMKILLASLVNRFGDSIDAIAFTWLVYQLTGSAAWSAFIFGVNKFPTIFVTPFAGVWVEGKNKKQIMVWTDIMRAVCVAFVATGYLFGWLQPWMLFAATLIISTVEAFRGPASMALTPQVLERKYYEYGISLSSSLSNVVELVGTAAAGGIVALLGVSGAIYIDMATFLLSALIIVFVKSKEKNLEKQIFNGKEYMMSLGDGIQYIRKSHAFLFFILVCLLLNALLTPINSLQAPLVSEILLSDEKMLSFISVACVLGMMFGTITYPWVKKCLRTRVFFALAGFGISAYYIGLILCRPLYERELFTVVYVSVTTALLGCFAAWLNTYMSVEFIKKVDEEYLARASGVFTAANVSATPVVSFLISAVIGVTGVANIFLGVGILAAVACIFIVGNRELNEEETEETAAGAEPVN